MLKINKLDEYSITELLNIFYWSHGLSNEQRMVAIKHYQEIFTNELAFRQGCLKEYQWLYEKNPSVYASLFVAIELGRRIERATPLKIGKVLSSEEFGLSLIISMGLLPQEELWLYGLNAKHEIIMKKTVHVGSITSCPFFIRDIVRYALKYNSQSIIVAHNHPSGHPQPSQNDIELSKRLANALKILDINLLDSFIIGNQQYHSLKELGILKDN